MGFRFRRSVKILPGLKLNISKSGTSVSVGGRGATVNFGKKGTRTTLGLPGTGLSYSDYKPYGSTKAPSGTSQKGGNPMLKVIAMIIGALVLAAIFRH